MDLRRGVHRRVAKQARCEHANELIKIIAKHGRRFFYDKEHDRVAHFEVDDRGRVWFVDDYTNERIYTHGTGFMNRWAGFTHGGTLRDLVEKIRDYITDEKTVDRHWLGPSYAFSDGDVWGYGAEAVAAVRAEAIVLPIIT